LTNRLDRSQRADPLISHTVNFKKNLPNFNSSGYGKRNIFTFDSINKDNFIDDPESKINFSMRHSVDNRPFSTTQATPNILVNINDSIIASGRNTTLMPIGKRNGGH